ncbi:MAG: CvpA family protein [Spirochaetia bacterium]|nr:CvpA family protein [Spirochaetia bacterium]MBR4796362.1 CvpA family protein [Spirochaetia bacterium]MBR5016911.1 CvpA family protein [Spirochaetia bacterium]
MNIADLIFLLLALFFVIKGFFRGFISEFMSMAALILGLIAALAFQNQLSALLKDMIKSDTFRPIAAFFLLFIGTYILVKLLELLLHNAIEAIKMNSLDRLLGLVWGLLETAVIVLIIVFLIYRFKFKAGISFLDESVVARYARDFLDGLHLDGFDLDMVKDLPGVIKKNV